MSIIDRVREVALRKPHSVAVRSEAGELTYFGFMERVDGLAADLRRHGIGPTSRVAILLERSPELIVAIVATLAAGATYIPLDPENPAARLGQIIDDSDPAIVLGPADEELLAGRGIPVLDPNSWSRRGEAIATDDRGPAYVIYTSGSTGRPKGVVVGHDSLANYLAWAVSELPFTGGGVPLFASIGFDHAVTCLFPPLLMGEPVVLLPPLQGGRNLAAALLTGHRYSYVKITPSHFRLLDGDQRAELGRSAALVMFGGERLTADLVADVRRDNPALPVMNHYGPTETTVGCCVYRVPVGLSIDPIPIGRPLPGVDTCVCRPDGSAASGGESSELLVGGAAPAQGYWRSPEQTAQAFINRPDDHGGQGRWYRTGDIVQRAPSGDFVYLGRVDDQLKILGHRVEVAEIETALRSHGSVRLAHVIASEQAEFQSLVAVVTTSLPRPSQAALQAHLQSLLPSVMVPRRIVMLDEIPLTSNGKLDRNAVLEAIAIGNAGAPDETVEEVVARKFAQALDHPHIRRDDDFFELGGDSLATVEIAVWLGEHFGIPLEPTALFEFPTIRTLAGHIRSFTHHRYAGEPQSALNSL
jgi:amino acid adenylation domain-containing protein